MRAVVPCRRQASLRLCNYSANRVPELSTAALTPPGHSIIDAQGQHFRFLGLIAQGEFSNISERGRNEWRHQIDGVEINGQPYAAHVAGFPQNCQSWGKVIQIASCHQPDYLTQSPPNNANRVARITAKYPLS